VAPRACWPQLRRAAGIRGADLELVVRPAAGAGRDPFDVAGALGGSGADAALLVAPARRAPRCLLPAPLVAGVPVGILPAASSADIEAWLGTVTGPVAPHTTTVMSMALNHFVASGHRLAGMLADRGEVALRLADRTSRDDLCTHLATGPRLAIYIGHGHSRGWCGYRDLDWEHVAAVPIGRPCGVVVALACNTLTRARGNEPFGCRWVRCGRAAAYLGSAHALRTEANAAFAVVLGGVLAEGPSTLGAALVRVAAVADPLAARAMASFRIIGDPLAPV